MTADKLKLIKSLATEEARIINKRIRRCLDEWPMNTSEDSNLFWITFCKEFKYRMGDNKEKTKIGSSQL